MRHGSIFVCIFVTIKFYPHFIYDCCDIHLCFWLYSCVKIIICWSILTNYSVNFIGGSCKHVNPLFLVVQICWQILVSTTNDPTTLKNQDTKGCILGPTILVIFFYLTILNFSYCERNSQYVLLLVLIRSSSYNFFMNKHKLILLQKLNKDPNTVNRKIKT